MGMNLKEAQNVAERFCNQPKNCHITLAEIRGALVMLSNFYEDNKRRDNEPIRGAYYRWKHATVEIIACKEHWLEITEVLNKGQEDSEGVR